MRLLEEVARSLVLFGGIRLASLLNQLLVVARSRGAFAGLSACAARARHAGCAGERARNQPNRREMFPNACRACARPSRSLALPVRHPSGPHMPQRLWAGKERAAGHHRSARAYLETVSPHDRFPSLEGTGTLTAELQLPEPGELIGSKY